VWARDAQLAPPGDWWTWWLILAGRGFGKTRSGAEFILQRVREGAKRIALVGPTAADVRDTMVETGPGSILQNCAPWDRPIYEPSKRRLSWPQYGAIATTFSADEPESFRGPGFDTAWCDELGAWRYQQETWDMLEMGFREGNPQGVITTTPRPTPVVRDLVADAKGKAPTVVVTRGSTYDNAANLAPKFLKRLLTKYAGTRLGLQELEALLLEDTPGALWTIDLLAKNRVRAAPPLKRVAVAIDPQAADPNRTAASEDDAETGIVAGGVDDTGDGYLLRDVSGHLSPGDWGERSVLLFDELDADFIVAEINNGGAMVPFVVRTAAEKLHREGKRPTPHINVRVVNASRGKHTRAEPISALDEQGRIRHVGYFGELEPQMNTWVPGEKSPDRLDARVWLFTALMLTEGADRKSVV
jgi:phage terminase large subunit-like protein